MTLSTIPYYVWPIFAYLIGSVSAAVLVSKLFGLGDPRDSGSGNPGATNVLRSGNKAAAAVTLLFDIAKGFVPVYLAQQAGMSNGVIAVTAIAAFMGHLYPLFLKFKGGKGVATALGVLAALSWKLVTLFGVVWLISAVIWRYSSLASLLAISAAGIASFAVFNQQEELRLIGAVFFILAFTFQRHRQNIERLTQGDETKIGQK